MRDSIKDEDMNESFDFVPESMQIRNFKLREKLFAEMLGASTLTFIGCGVSILNNTENVISSISGGFVIITMIYSLAYISGCHMNPAVSIAFYMKKELTLKELLLYIPCQIVGCTIGSVLLGAVRRGNFIGIGCNLIKQTIMKYENGEYKIDALSYLIAVLVEIILTFFLLMVIFGTNDKSFKHSNKAGIIIGISIYLFTSFGLPFTGCSLNPARSLGPAIVEAIAGQYEGIKEVWVFIVGPILGGVLGGLTYTKFFKTI